MFLKLIDWIYGKICFILLFSFDSTIYIYGNKYQNHMYLFNDDDFLLYISTTIASASILYIGLNIFLGFFGSKFGLDFYHFIILGIILFPFLFILLLKISKKKESPHYFLWFLTFFSAGIIPIFFFFYFGVFGSLLGTCSDWCGIGLIFITPISS